MIKKHLMNVIDDIKEDYQEYNGWRIEHVYEITYYDDSDSYLLHCTYVKGGARVDVAFEFSNYIQHLHMYWNTLDHVGHVEGGDNYIEEPDVLDRYGELPSANCLFRHITHLMDKVDKSSYLEYLMYRGKCSLYEA